jgi:hypothetical protein
MVLRDGAIKNESPLSEITISLPESAWRCRPMRHPHIVESNPILCVAVGAYAVCPEPLIDTVPR